MLALPELFNTPLLLSTVTDPRWYAAAEPIPAGAHHPGAAMRELARRARDGHRGAVLRAGRRPPATTPRPWSTRTGRFLGVYRKHHVPTPHAGNYEPFYFHQPDVGFPVFENGVRAHRHLHLLRPPLPGDRAHLRGQGRLRSSLNPSATGGPRSRSRCGSSSSRRTRWRTGYFVGGAEPRRTGPALRHGGRVLRQELLLRPARQNRPPRRGGASEEVLIADLDLDEIEAVNQRWHTARLFQDRRPETSSGSVACPRPTPLPAHWARGFDQR